MKKTNENTMLIIGMLIGAALYVFFIDKIAVLFKLSEMFRFGLGIFISLASGGTWLQMTKVNNALIKINEK